MHCHSSCVPFPFCCVQKLFFRDRGGHYNVSTNLTYSKLTRKRNYQQLFPIPVTLLLSVSCVSSIINCLIYMCSVPLTVSCKVPANPPLRAHICGIPICPLTTLLAANGAPLLFMSMYMYIVYVYCIVPQGSSNKYSPQCTAHVWCPYLAYLSTLNMGYP